MLGEVSPHLHTNSWCEKTSLLITGIAPGNSPRTGKGRQQGYWGPWIPCWASQYLQLAVRIKGQKTRLEEGLKDKATGKCNEECQWTGEECWGSNIDQQAQAEGEIGKKAKGKIKLSKNWPQFLVLPSKKLPHKRAKQTLPTDFL